MFNQGENCAPTLFLAAFAAVLLFTNYGFGQGYGSVEKGRMKDILKIVKSEILKNYYDPKYHGIDLEARFKLAQEKLDASTSVPQAYAIIAQAVVDFNDSHLYLIPPSTNIRVDYGWRTTFMGDKCIVTDVKPGSDAEAKGLKPGDQILAIGNFRLNRKEMWKVHYFYNVISKRRSLSLTVIAPGASEPKTLDVASEIREQPQLISASTFFRLDGGFYNEENDKHRFIKLGGINVWRMPSWAFDPSQADGTVARVKNGSSIIFDLRGNGGGYTDNLENIAAHFVTQETKIAELQGRKRMDPLMAKPKGSSVFGGKIVVLIDSESGSASEIFAKFVQLEKLGVVMGDVSAGAVMQSRAYEQSLGAANIVPFAISITNADVIMSDGKSLEHVGVVPDELIIPTPLDIAAGRDVVMARAVESLGGKVDPVVAGKWFPFFWKK